MKNLDKMEVFRNCGFFVDRMYPLIAFDGYDKVMEKCYEYGYSIGYSFGVLAQPESKPKNLLDTWELVKKVKDLETANARLFERNHELQVDSEESLKEVEEYSKRNQALSQRNTSLIGENGMLRDNHRDKLEVIENLQSLLDNAHDEIEHLHKHNGDLARAGLSSPKSKFVITVEEF